jgi:hypothetical protein
MHVNCPIWGILIRIHSGPRIQVQEGAERVTPKKSLEFVLTSVEFEASGNKMKFSINKSQLFESGSSKRLEYIRIQRGAVDTNPDYKSPE